MLNHPYLQPLKVGAGLGLALILAAACTEDPPKPIPTPTPPVQEVNAEARDYSQYTELKWTDEFDGSSLDPQKWTPEVKDTWFNNELQATTSSPNNVFVTGGNLHIQARKEAYNGKQYTSARIVTRDKKSFDFGRFDVRAKLPKGKGVWPAIWMLGANESQVGWPACGEIDIMELRGSKPNINVTTAHYGTSANDHRYKGKEYQLPSGDLSDDYHTFSIVRSRDQLRWFVDGTQVYSLTASDASPYPFNAPFYAILNVAVGGDFDGNPDATVTFPKEMLVDYVRFYQYKQ